MPFTTVTYTLAQGQRIANALGEVLNLTAADGITPRAATQAEYADWLRDVTRRMVVGQEIKDAQAAVAQPASLDIT
jgi:hypothetical protein